MPECRDEGDEELFGFSPHVGIMDEFPVVLSKFFGELLGVGGKELLFLFNVTGDLEGLDIGQGAF
ncbi:MAG: hypothetical protein L7T84_11455 [Akkermansiaceae bacterium]|nr:hypothetical protein [Akkermansiaceae bacterium]